MFTQLNFEPQALCPAPSSDALAITPLIHMHQPRPLNIDPAERLIQPQANPTLGRATDLTLRKKIVQERKVQKHNEEDDCLKAWFACLVAEEKHASDGSPDASYQGEEEDRELADPEAVRLRGSLVQEHSA